MTIFFTPVSAVEVIKMVPSICVSVWIYWTYIVKLPYVSVQRDHEWQDVGGVAVLTQTEVQCTCSVAAG